MSREIRGRHIIGGIALAALFSLPFDAMIVNATLTDIRMEQAFRAAAKRAADRAVADTVPAAPQPDQSATTSTFGSRSEDGPEESPLAATGAAVSREDGSSKAGETATSGLGTASRNDHLHSVRVHAGPERRGNQGVTAGETASWSARVSSGSGERPMPRMQGVRPERSVSVKHPEQEAADTGRSPYLYEVTSYSHGCTLPTSGRETHAQRAANGRWPIADVTVAADTTLHPFGTEVLIEGIGFRTVGDRGSAIKGRRLDLFMDSCKEARRFGRRWLRVFPVPAETTKESN